MSEPQPEQIPVVQLAPAEIAEVDLYQHREKIYTRKIEGFFQRLRLYTGWPLLLGYFLLPWFNWDGRQAVLFDLPARKFYIFGLTFWPQDFPLLAWLLIIAAFALFTVTVWLGRVWCGYTCPQTVWTAIFMWAEQLCEGSRNQRIKLDKQPMSAEKALRKASKHGTWLLVALATGLTFVGYFSPMRDLTLNLLSFNLGFWEIAWTVFFTAATYINAGWMREQVCIYMCPYARFQAVMFDSDTLIVSYDPARGEPRGPRKHGVDHKAMGLGDCIDCEICVQVCPTGIDIRDGLQYECINCALCIDACDSVMDKMQYPRGLIRYTTENDLAGTPTKMLRPRLLGYGAGLLLMATLFMTVVLMRVPVGLDAIRDRDRLYMETSTGQIENVYTLKLRNMDNHPHTFQLSVEGLPAATWIGQEQVSLASGDTAEVPVRLQVDPVAIERGRQDITFRAQALDSAEHSATTESRFLGPQR